MAIHVVFISHLRGSYLIDCSFNEFLGCSKIPVTWAHINGINRNIGAHNPDHEKTGD